MKQGLNQINAFIIQAQPYESAMLSVATTSVKVTFTSIPSLKDYEVVIQNSGSKVAYVAFSNSTTGVLAATVPTSTPAQNCTPILGGAIYTWQKNSDSVQVDTISAICGGSDTTTLFFTTIQGS